MPEIRELLVLHHSHFDIGYTHNQPTLLRWQQHYIDQALDMCEQTEAWDERDKFRWTCESSYPVLQWLQHASEADKARFKKFLANGQMALSGSLLHHTPLAGAAQLRRSLRHIDTLERELDTKVTTAIHHDINGVPWPYAQMMLDSGIDFFIMGINIHMGGLPRPRPNAFNWNVPDGRNLLTYNGEHYSLFGQYADVHIDSTDEIERGVNEYLKRFEGRDDYLFDFAYLTVTNIPLYDNNPPDQTLPALLKRFNDEDRGITIRYVTPEQLRERVLPYQAQLATERGDWTDYWNFGSGSSAREGRIARRAKSALQTAELVNAVLPETDSVYRSTTADAWEQVCLYDEHTWGWWGSVILPDAPEAGIQFGHKQHMAWQANSLASYLLGRKLETLAGNPLQSGPPAGVMLVNGSNVPVDYDLRLHPRATQPGNHLRSDRMHRLMVNEDHTHTEQSFGVVHLPPFSWRTLRIADLEPAAESQLITVDHGEVHGVHPGAIVGFDDIVRPARIETPSHICEIDQRSGRITSLVDKATGWQVLDQSSEYTLFQYVQESVDPSQLTNRAAYFPRDVDKGNLSISAWAEWRRRHRSFDKLVDWRIDRAAHSATLVFRFEAPGVEWLEQKFTFFDYQPQIDVVVSYNKDDTLTPEGTFLALPLNLEQGWGAHYDTAGQLTEVDAEQLHGVCRDFVTVDSVFDIHDGAHGVALGCPDAPLVQFGEFSFGRERQSVPREANPVVLAWPMNNYWDTNFPGRQPGFAEFRYSLHTHGSFDARQVAEFGARAAARVYNTVQIECTANAEGSLFEVVGDGIAVSDVSAAADGNGLVLWAHNVGAVATSGEIRFPGRGLVAAERVDVRERPLGADERGSVEASGHAVRVALGAHATVGVRVALQL
ncbi:MAG TPA: hypothetical protein VFU07_02155 [Candidatus Lumbricidophila sp.]|nr:hypothetical protein [Candidatus Lumbricidophila sp.]